MNKRAVAGVSAVLLVALVAFLLHGRKAERVEEPPVAVQLPPVEVPPPRETAPAPAPASVAAPPAIEAIPQPVVQAATREDLFPQNPGAHIGYYKEYRTAEFETYLVLMGFAGASEIVDGKMADEGSIRHLQRQYELTDDELIRLIDYGRSALATDRSFQSADQDSLCARKDTFRSLEQFGAALNEHVSRLAANQESLGRNAATALGPQIYSKITDKVLSRPRQEMTVGDFPTLFAKRDHGLETEIERFCSHGK